MNFLRIWTFDSTEEMYVDCNKEGIADFIFIRRKMSDKAKEIVIQKLKEYWGEDIFNLSPQEQLRKFGRYLDSLIIETFNNTSFPAAL